MTEESTTSPLVSALRGGGYAVGVWGCGHIGASAMYYLSRHGICCIGYDIEETRVQEIRQGRFLSTDVVPAGRVQAPDVRVAATRDWTDLKSRKVLIHIISIPTERGAEPSSAALEAVMPLICETIRDSELDGVTPLIAIESTIQPTWIDTVVLPTLHASGLRPGIDVHVGAAPRRDWFSGNEHSLATLPRIVGGDSEESTKLLVDFYSIVCDEVVPARDAYHAAFTKVIENLVRFQGLALANGLALAFPQYDMTHVLRLASSKWNIPLFHPSMGIGGHCIPLAPRYALAEGGPGNAYLDPVLAAVTFNQDYFARLYQARLRELLQDCRSIVILGLAYTPDVKMHKLSPALDAVECLKDTPLLRVHDPYYAAEDVDDICGVPTLTFPDDLRDCDGILLVTAHTAYREAAVEGIVQPGTVIVDNFGTWSDRHFAPGVRYHEVGRRNVEDHRDSIHWPEPASTLSD
jgi:nucleotide sugar dehydrogenase